MVANSGISRKYRVLFAKTDFGIFRYVHFLALAYLFWILAGDEGRNLDFEGRFGKTAVKVIHKGGQQSLATFMGGLVLGQFCGFLLDVINRDNGTLIFGSGADMALMV